jgi:hypothetical protein
MATNHSTVRGRSLGDRCKHHVVSSLQETVFRRLSVSDSYRIMQAATNAKETADLVARLVNGTETRPRSGIWTSGTYLSTFDSRNPTTSWLSNFYPSPFPVSSKLPRVPTAEHFYQYSKVLPPSCQTSSYLLRQFTDDDSAVRDLILGESQPAKLQEIAKRYQRCIPNNFNPVIAVFFLFSFEVDVLLKNTYRCSKLSI